MTQDLGEKPSQTTQLFNILKDGIEHTKCELIRKIYGSQKRADEGLRARIKDLRNLGFVISSRVFGDTRVFKMEIKRPSRKA